MTCACGAGWAWVDYRQNHSAEVARGGIGPARADTFAMPKLGAQGPAERQACLSLVVKI